MQSKMKRNNKLSSIVKRLKDGYVTVGIHKKEGDHKDSDITVAQVGAIHEYGANGMPERSFMRSTMHEEKKILKKQLRKIAKKQVQGKSQKTQIGMLGEYLRGKIQSKITDIRTPANSAATIKKKKSSNPLIDTGQLKQSIHSVQHKKKP